MTPPRPGRPAGSRPPRGAATYAVPAVLAPAVATAAELLLPGRVGEVVSALAERRDPAGALQFLGLLLLAAAAANVINTFATGAYVAAQTARVRAQVARAVILSPRGRGAADLVTRILVDARQPAVVLPIVTSMALSAAGVLVGLTLLALLDWVLLVGVLVGLLLVMLLLRRLVDDLSVLFQRYRGAQAEVGQRLLEVQSGAVTIRAAGTWRQEARRVLAPMAQVRAAGEALWSAQRRFAWKASLFAPAILVVTIAVGGWALSAGRVGVGDFAAAVGYAYVVLGGLDGIEAAAGLGAVRAGRARLAEVSQGPPAADAAPMSVLRRRAGGGGPTDVGPADVGPTDVGPADVVLDDVCVEGEDGRMVLDSVSLTIPAGAFVAITGASGSGRSTLAGVIAGIVAPTRGRVLIGGRPAGEANRPGGRRRATFGQARPAFLGGTIAGLVGLAVDTGPDTVRQAARLAHLVDVVDALPLGFDTPLDEVELSGGELQRLAIAQALARDSSVLVLDDVTASLDPATEREVLGALLAARARHTLVVVTNRGAVLRRADTVITLDAGAVRPLGESVAAR